MFKTPADISNIVNKYAEALGSEIDFDKIILVGSHATGQTNEWSDIEFAVISKDFDQMPYIERLKILSLATKNVDHSLVPIGGYTPDEYEHPKKTLHMGWIKSKGKIVYSRNK